MVMGGFLAAVLGGGGGHHRADLVDKRALGPQRSGLVEEVLHLRGHVAKARRHAEDHRVVVGKLERLGDWRGLVGL